MRYYLIDRIDDLQPFRSVRARKLTSCSEDFWESTPAGPIMPASLVLESLFEAGGWLIVVSTEHRRRGALASIGWVEFPREVRPGDILEIEGAIDSMTDEAAMMSGRITVGGQPVLEAGDIMCVLLEAEKLESADATAHTLRLLTRAEGT